MATSAFGSGFAAPSWRAETQPKEDELFDFGTAKQKPFNVADSELFKQSADTAQQQMAGDVAGFDEQANEARESMIAGQAYRTKATREALLGQGLGKSGTYLEQGIIAPEQENQRERESFERGLTAERGALSMQQQQAGQNAAQNLLNTQITGQGQTMDAALREREMVNNAMEFTSKQEWDTWATLQGFSEAERARAWQSAENAKGITSQEKMFFANLSLDEQKFYEDARQFNSQREFDVWALEQGMDENQRQRVWQAVQNDKELANRVEIAAMQIDAEKWKQTRVEAMQQAGFTQEEAMLRAQQEYDAVQSEMDRQLQRDVEAGRLSIQEKELAQQASQFESQQEFETWALQQGWEQDAIARSWESSENATQRTWQAQEYRLDRQLEREVEEGRITVEEMRLAENARQFNSQQEFEQAMAEQGWAQDAITRAWQSSENAMNRTVEMQMQALDNELQRYGINLAATMPYLESLPPDQAAAAFNALAGAAGLSYVDANGTEQPGFPPSDPIAVAEAELNDVWTKLQAGESVSRTDIEELLLAYQGGIAPEGFNPSTDYLSTDRLGDYEYDKPGDDYSNRGWYLYPSTIDWVEANENKFFLRDGELVQLIGYYQPSGDAKDEKGYVTYKNVRTGATINDYVHAQD